MECTDAEVKNIAMPGVLMDELEKLDRAKAYMEKLANGIDPITGTAVADSDVINNVRVSRCLFYVAGILHQIIENGGAVGRPKKAEKLRKQKFSITFEELSRFPISEVPIPVSEFSRRVNGLIPPEGLMTKLSYKSITRFLVDANLITESVDENGKITRNPTGVGETLGIKIEDRVGARGAYKVILYDRNAQQFLLDNMSAIVDIHNGSEKS